MNEHVHHGLTALVENRTGDDTRPGDRDMDIRSPFVRSKHDGTGRAQNTIAKSAVEIAEFRHGRRELESFRQRGEDESALRVGGLARGLRHP
jgi:hypothetical protein